MCMIKTRLAGARALRQKTHGGAERVDMGRLRSAVRVETASSHSLSLSLAQTLILSPCVRLPPHWVHAMMPYMQDQSI